MHFFHSTVFFLLLGLIVFVVGTLLLLRRFNNRGQSAASGLQLYIGNLPYRVTQADLHAEFSHYGRIAETRVVTDRRSGRSKGYGFVTFKDARDANKALAAHGQQLDGRSLVVHMARPKQ
jgi:RNA recognition motif-containing protein